MEAFRSLSMPVFVVKKGMFDDSMYPFLEPGQFLSIDYLSCLSFDSEMRLEAEEAFCAEV